MANKSIPDSIAGVEIHPLARGKEGRTHKLLQTLTPRGASDAPTPGLSMMARRRVLATAYLLLPDTSETVSDRVRQAVNDLDRTPQGYG